MRDFVLQRGVLEALEEPPDVSTALNMTEKKKMKARRDDDLPQGSLRLRVDPFWGEESGTL
jgi:hypothetical protein